MLRWIYTNEIRFSRIPGVTDADDWLDLLYGSYALQLVQLFKICEQRLLKCVSVVSSPRFYDVAKKVGANQLLVKCLELRLNVRAGSRAELDIVIDEINTDHPCGSSNSSVRMHSQRLILLLHNVEITFWNSKRASILI